MQKKTLATFLLLSLATLAHGFQNSAEWVKYTSIEGRYNVLLPQQPKLSTQEATAATGEKMLQYMAQSGDSDGFFMIAYFDYGTGIVFSLDKARAGVVNSANGTLLNQQAISMGGYPGSDFKLAAKLQNMDVLARARIYDMGGRVFVLQHIFKKVDDSPKIAEKTARFFDSFKVTVNK